MPNHPGSSGQVRGLAQKRYITAILADARRPRIIIGRVDAVGIDRYQCCGSALHITQEDIARAIGVIRDQVRRCALECDEPSISTDRWPGQFGRF